MSDIRPLAPADVPEVALLFGEIFQQTGRRPNTVLQQYLSDLFLDGPFASADISSMVFVEGDGRIGGFIGVFELPMAFGDRILRAAVCSALMVQDRRRNPFVGARLMKSVIAGPQDVTLSETASDAAAAIWSRLGGNVITGYSLDWIRVISPARFGLQTIGNRVKGARILGPLATGIDKLVRRGPKEQVRWRSIPAAYSAPGGYAIEDVGDEFFRATLSELAGEHVLRPAWTQEQLDFALADLEHKSQWGTMVRRVVKNRSGASIGLFIYYLRSGGVAQVMQILAAPANFNAVFECLLADANNSGAVALRGRTQPLQMQVLMQQRCYFFKYSASVAYSKDAEVMQAFESGAAFFNGLAGESWIRLVGDELR